MSLSLSLSLTSFAAAAAAVAAQNYASPETYVTTLSGTDSRYDLSHGNLLPVVATPWGFNQWAPVTDNDGTWANWWFHPTDRRFFGIRCTHQPSPWIGDYGQFRIAASITDPGHSDAGQMSGYDPTASAWSPYYFNATLLAYGNRAGFTALELTSTSHAAVIRVTFPPLSAGPVSDGFNQTRRILLRVDPGDALSVSNSNGAPGVTGSTTANSGGVPGNFAHYFALVVSSGVNGDAPVTALSTGTVNSNGDYYAFLDFDPTDPAANVLTLRVATSLISAEQAVVNLNAEVASLSFDAVKAASQAAWKRTLSRVTINDVGQSYTAAQQNDFLITYYSALYRASLFPRNLAEVAANGSLVHWSPYDAGNVHPGVLSTDSGFWDAYRTVYPWLSISNPTQLGVVIQGWVNAFNEGGWLPKWASPGHRGSMVGTMGDVSLADAIVKNIPGFDMQGAYAAIRKDAFVTPPPSPVVGRPCLDTYLQNGYIPQGGPSVQGTCYEVVARTQNYWLSDFAIAQAALTLNYTDDAAILTARSQNYSMLFDNSTGFFRSRSMAGTWTEPFDEFAWGGDYTEAGPWQYRFYVPYDPKGLAATYAAAGLDMCDVLDDFNTIPSIFHLGAYGSEIHEQTEMALLCYGQNEHDNQPVHHVLYMYIASDNSSTGSCASRGQKWLRYVMTNLYKPGADAYCGDEDNGEVAAWYLLSAMGLYSLAPGTPNYVLGSPLFTSMTVQLDNNGTLNIIALNNTASNVYVQSVTWNGVAVNGTSVSYFDLMKGGTLQFVMTDTPVAAAPSGPKKNASAAKLRGRSAAAESA